MMQRSIEADLVQWKNQKNHMPLIVRGARQIGKSFVIEQFGRKHFEQVVTLNFELSPQLKTAFIDLDPHKIIQILELFVGAPIQPNQTLLFLDEIQECPEAIMALRYFKEKMPELHVIAAGSLLEFALQSKNFRMPVGRVQYVHMKPLSFKEFLIAFEQHQLKEFIENVTWETEIPSLIHDKLLEYVRLYFFLGGMPAVIQDYLDQHSLLSARRIQTAILATYRGDFGKYANVAKHKYLELLFMKAPEIIAQQFRYVDVARDVQSRDLKDALDNLSRAGLMTQVFSTNATGLPLRSLIHERRFKLLFLDIGLVSSAVQYEPQLMLDNQILAVNRGALTEQFVGQELLANQDCYVDAEVYYWSRDARGSTAEIDYIIQAGNQIIPVEVKSGSTGQMKSLHLFMQERQSVLGVRVSALPLSRHLNIATIPFYLVSELQRLTTR
ncbi:MAG: ATP-binding protein [Legionellaceae bacterium]